MAVLFIVRKLAHLSEGSLLHRLTVHNEWPKAERDESAAKIPGGELFGSAKLAKGNDREAAADALREFLRSSRSAKLEVERRAEEALAKLTAAAGEGGGDGNGGGGGEGGPTRPYYAPPPASPTRSNYISARPPFAANTSSAAGDRALMYGEDL